MFYEYVLNLDDILYFLLLILYYWLLLYEMKKEFLMYKFRKINVYNVLYKNNFMIGY